MGNLAALRNQGGSGGGMSEQGSLDPSLTVEAVSEYYRQPRFACGRLFVSNVVTSLVVNTHFNPSLAQLIGAMISANIQMVKVSGEWEGKPYMDYFDHLLFERQLMSIGIYRKTEGFKAVGEARISREASQRSSGQIARKSSSASIMKRMSTAFGGPEKKMAARDFTPPHPAYVLTAPPAKENFLMSGDRVVCFAANQM